MGVALTVIFLFSNRTMQWTAILGTWHTANEQIERDCRKAAALALLRGNGIITGGSPGVDFAVITEALKRNPQADLIRIILPASMELYESHLLKSASNHVITRDMAESLIKQIHAVQLRNSKAVRAIRSDVCDVAALNNRNSAIIAEADELSAFQINDSLDIEDAIQKARARENAISVMVLQYFI